jgi:hypothetical protein
MRQIILPFTGTDNEFDGGGDLSLAINRFFSQNSRKKALFKFLVYFDL